MELFEELKLLQDKARRYDLLAERMQMVLAKLGQAESLISEASDAISPKIRLEVGNRGRRTSEDVEEQLTEEFNSLTMIDGYVVTLESLMKKYDLKTHQAYKLFAKLKERKEVDTRKNGRITELFGRKMRPLKED